VEEEDNKAERTSDSFLKLSRDVGRFNTDVVEVALKQAQIGQAQLRQSLMTQIESVARDLML
jgi:hypothetical protein